MSYKVVFLDVDGVLVDSEKAFNICWRKAAEHEGYLMTYEQALQLRSLDSHLANELFLDWYDDVDAYTVVRAARKRIMLDYIKSNPLRAKKGVVDFIYSVKEIPLRVTIVTSSPISRITEYLESVGIGISLFDSIITTEQVKRGKPFPDVYFFACERMGITPSECIAIEDSPNGVKSAHNAGCYTVMIPDLTPITDAEREFVDRCEDSLETLSGTLKELL